MSARLSKSNSQLVPIGKVGRPHGLRGAFFVAGREDLIPSGYGEVYIGPTSEDAKPAKILATLWQSQRPVLKCSVAGDRTQAEALTHQTIFVPADRLRQWSDQGSILWLDLEGAQVRDADNVLLGVVTQVYNTGSSDIVEVTATAENQNPSPETAGKGCLCVDIPLIWDYVDLDRPLELGPPAVLRLKVSASYFADLWQEQA